MKRSSFLKSLVTLIFAPKVIKDIEFRSVEQIKLSNIVNCVPPSGKLISDLNLLTPHYYKQYVEKYGNESYTMYNDFLGLEKRDIANNFYWHENKNP